MVCAPEEFSTVLCSRFVSVVATQQKSYQYTNDIGPLRVPSGIANAVQKKICRAPALDRRRGRRRRQYDGPVAHGGLIRGEILLRQADAVLHPQDQRIPLLHHDEQMVAMSWGTVTLRDMSMSAALLINPNCYTRPADRVIVVELFRYLWKTNGASRCIAVHPWP